jgi:toxin ParE1/3/4
MLLEWSVYAIADREAIFDYFGSDSSRAAIAIDDRIQTCVDGLAQFPKMGRAGRIVGTRDLVISGTPYIDAYRVAEDRVRILRILHGAQKWPDELLGQLK